MQSATAHIEITPESPSVHTRLDTQTINQQAQIRIITELAKELNSRPSQISAAINLLDTGCTVPFIARYRKEATGGLDDTTLRLLDSRLTYLREREYRRAAVLSAIEEQGKLSIALKAQIEAAETKQALEDLYAPFKPKRQTRAQLARDSGLGPLADSILRANSKTDPAELALNYVNTDTGIKDVKSALDGARDILAEQFSEQAQLLADLREFLFKNAVVYAAVVEGKEVEGSNFQDYFSYQEQFSSIPSHRALALFRARQQGIITLRLGLDSQLEELPVHPCLLRIVNYLHHLNTSHTLDPQILISPVDLQGIYQAEPSLKNSRATWLESVFRWTWRVKLQPSFENELLRQLRNRAECEAIEVFASNLKDLLLAPPAGRKVVLGLDPGLRTGVKVAVIDATGKLLATQTIYPHAPRNAWDDALETLSLLIKKYSIELIAIGNGTASRETEKLARDLIKRHPNQNISATVVSEAGASVYSASEFASLEFPELDVSLRGAVSIARRLQDPLAELVKIDPKAIGVGQYQHDVNQHALATSLDQVVEDCVNAIGVDVNTASIPLLSRVSGLNQPIARSVVAYRDQHGAFKERQDLLKISRFSEKVFEQSAGFLRIADGHNPLDSSAVHPEAYPLVERILKNIQLDIKAIMGNHNLLNKIRAHEYTDQQFGLPTIVDILAELEKPGRDPRPEFKTAHFQEGVETLDDLKNGMILEGVVTNVAAFGAFVDIGVHQDGLVHISALAEKFVKDPRDVVRVGQTVRVKVLEVDKGRQRINLTMRLNDSLVTASPNTIVETGANSGFKKPDFKKASSPNHTFKNLPSNTMSKPQHNYPENTAIAMAFAKLKP